MKFSLVFILAVSLEQCLGGNILFILPSPGKSHYNLGDRLVEELIKRGHEVTMIATLKRDKPIRNFTEIVVPDTAEEIYGNTPHKNAEEDKFNLRHLNPIDYLAFTSLGQILVEKIMNHQSVKNLLHSNQKFDLIIGECFLTEALLAGFSNRFKAPLAAYATAMPNVWTNEMVGNPYPASYVPDYILGYTDKMSFFQRIVNFLYTTLSQAHYYTVHLSGQNDLMKKHFGKDLPHIKDILSHTSLVLVNHHFSLAFPRPYLPNMIEIGGYHVRSPKALPQDLKKFMDDAKDGVIYFSMGSHLQSSEFPKEKFDGILRAFSKLKQRVLWKFETQRSDLPKNVKIAKWMPQSDILAHPNVKLFITHGGFLSITESVLRGVPVIGIPIFADQPINVKYVEKFEMGVKVSYDDLDEQHLYTAIQEVLTNPKYSRNMKFRSRILQDLPQQPIDTAIYWLEYVMRHKGAPHLRSGAQDLAWYELYLLDVYAFIGGVVFVVVFVSLKCISCVMRTLCGKKKSVTPSKKKN